MEVTVALVKMEYLLKENNRKALFISRVGSKGKFFSSNLCRNDRVFSVLHVRMSHHQRVFYTVKNNAHICKDFLHNLLNKRMLNLKI